MQSMDAQLQNSHINKNRADQRSKRQDIDADSKSMNLENLCRITKGDLVNLLKNPMWIFFATGFPLLMTIILGYLTGDSYGKTVTSYDYYGITGIIYAVLNSGMISANAFMEERIKKPNMRIIYAPGSVRNLYLSKIISSFLFVYGFHVVDLIFLQLVFHVTIGNIGLFLLILAVLELWTVTLGIMLCCLIKTESVTNQIQSIIVNLLAVLGGVIFSLDGFGKAGRIISMCSPVKWIVKAFFEMSFDNDLSLYTPVVAGMLLCILVMVVICDRTFRKEDCIC